ncbi:MAG: hypothetical protein NXH72_04385 [Hyphomonadaceae bacterium]|nr:hypothetical protein [Hyphomonadaceae bacterium]
MLAPAKPVAPIPPAADPVTILDLLPDAPTRRAVEALQSAAPATAAELQAAVVFAHGDGANAQDLSRLVLEALFSQFQAQALTMRGASSGNYHAIIAGLADGMAQLKANQSPWCDGLTIADYLTQNEDELVPALLSEFTYGSPQYVWAMDWMTTVLTTLKQAQDTPQRHARPGFRDEAVLQQEGLALGSEQWALALQIAAFANAEGTSYGQMQEVISGMDVCELGIAVETVSARLPGDVRGRIWADLMPELMVGNTPYVIWRVTDYFFIG